MNKQVVRDSLIEWMDEQGRIFN